jgi:hypothetical protein
MNGLTECSFASIGCLFGPWPCFGRNLVSSVYTLQKQRIEGSFLDFLLDSGVSLWSVQHVRLASFFPLVAPKTIIS